jgi:hypothetical protein
MFVSAAGAALFANVNPYIATVLPLSVVSKIMTNHPANEEFVRNVQDVQDRDGAKYGRNHNPSKLRAGCFNIFSPELAKNGMPPADNSVFVFSECEKITCRYLEYHGGYRNPSDGNTERRISGMGLRKRCIIA